MEQAEPLSPAQCAGMIRQARSVVAVTGAGISTAAGIPDFRGPQGLYVTRRYDPEKTFDIDGFRRDPGCFYEFCRDFVALAQQVRPTLTHAFLADLERAGKLAGIVTQNIDMLHQVAGSRAVIELHGSCRGASCCSCARRFEDLSYAWWERVMAAGPAPPVAACPGCGGVLKPDIVFFGETVRGYAEAERLEAGCDLLLVLGSSLQVAPASFLPYETSAPTLVVNRGDVMLAAGPNRFFVDQDLDRYFREVAECLSGSEIMIGGSPAGFGLREQSPPEAS